ncbi:hypothetical protein KY285_020351 [Solanum tuberosum]|nr:hypothetical protein KY285_020351 [Solanum tuberosum]
MEGNDSNAEKGGRIGGRRGRMAVKGGRQIIEKKKEATEVLNCGKEEKLYEVWRGILSRFTTQRKSNGQIASNITRNTSLNWRITLKEKKSQTPTVPVPKIKQKWKELAMPTSNYFVNAVKDLGVSESASGQLGSYISGVVWSHFDQTMGVTPRATYGHHPRTVGQTTARAGGPWFTTATPP